MNPCPCGHLGDVNRQCRRAPSCGEDYRARLSGPLLDRIDLVISVPALTAAELTLPPPAESSAVIAARIVQARERQEVRFRRLRSAGDILCNAEADGALLDQAACPEPQAVSLLRQAAERLGLSGRGYHRVLRVARTIADLAASDRITRSHVAEAVGYRPS